MADEERGATDGGRRFTAALAVACVALAALVVLLALQNRSLRADLERAHGGSDDAPRLAAGDTVAPLTVFDDTGASLRLDWSSNSRSVVLVYSSTCPACRASFPAWDAFAATLEGQGRVRIVGLQLDRPHPSSGSAPSEPQGVRPYPVYGIDRAGNESFLDVVPVIPGTFVIDARGAVRVAHFGVPGDDVLAALGAALQPGAR